MRSLICVASNFQDEEVIYPFYKLQEFSEVTIASCDGKIVYGKYGVPARASKSFSEIDTNEYDVLIIPGGFECPDRLRIDDECIRIVQEMIDKNKVVGAICHGPWVLISANRTKGRDMTGYKAVHIDLSNSGANVLDSSDVVVDGNLVTAPHYKNNPQFMLAVQSLATNSSHV